MNLANARALLQKFDFTRLFVEELGWSNPSSGKTVPMSVKGIAFNRREVAQLSGVVVIEIVTDDGAIPDAEGRVAIHIHQYELHGEDRATYGEGMFAALAERLQALKIPNCNKSGSTVTVISSRRIRR